MDTHCVVVGRWGNRVARFVVVDVDLIVKKDFEICYIKMYTCDAWKIL